MADEEATVPPEETTPGTDEAADGEEVVKEEESTAQFEPVVSFGFFCFGFGPDVVPTHIVMSQQHGTILPWLYDVQGVFYYVPPPILHLYVGSKMMVNEG
jgi:hypothetical protein